MDGNYLMMPGPKIALQKTPIFLRPLVFLLTLSWVFLGWPQIFNFPPVVQLAHAVSLESQDFETDQTDPFVNWDNLTTGTNCDWIADQDFTPSNTTGPGGTNTVGCG